MTIILQKKINFKSYTQNFKNKYWLNTCIFSSLSVIVTIVNL